MGNIVSDVINIHSSAIIDTIAICIGTASTIWFCQHYQIAHRLHQTLFGNRGAADDDDEALFKDPPPCEECPICFLPLPDPNHTFFKTCCGKRICCGCMYAMSAESRGRGKVVLCAFCRKPPSRSPEEEDERMKKCMDADNAFAFCILARDYEHGDGVPQDFAKANELYLKAGELGCPEAYLNLGSLYDIGRGVEVDKNKTKHFYELAAMNGCVGARHNLGCLEGEAGNQNRARKHFMIAAKAGYKDSLDTVKKGYMMGYFTKDEFANTLRAYQKAHDGMKSDMRDKFGAFYHNQRKSRQVESR